MTGWDALLAYARVRAKPGSDTVSDIIAFAGMDDAMSVMLDESVMPLRRAYAALMLYCAAVAEELVRRGSPPKDPVPAGTSWDRARASAPLSLDDAQLVEQLREGFYSLGTIRMLMHRAG